MARLSDADWMSRFVTRAGSQRAAAEQLGVSPSTVSKVIRGQRNGTRYRDAARAGAAGRRISPPAPTARTPRRVRGPVRRPSREGKERVVTGSPRAAGREVERSINTGRTVEGFTVNISGATRSGGYRHKNDRGWSGPLTVPHPSESELTQLTAGTEDDILDVLRHHFPWLGGGSIHAITWED